MIRYTYDARGQMVAVYEDGTVVPVLGAETNAGMAQGTSGAGSAAPETGGDANGYAGGAGYARNSGYSRNYAPRTPDFGSDDPTDPTYADGTRHPAMGGAPRTAGGVFAQQSAADGRGGQQQVNVPGGAAAGPFSTRAAYPGGGGNSHGGSADGGGGGGGPSALYNAWKAKLTGKLMPGSSSYGDYPDYKPPKEKKEPMRGPYAHGLDPDQALGLAMRPTAMIPAAFPGLSGASPVYENLAALPAAQLAMLSKRGFKGRPMDYANSIGNFYEKAGTTNDLPDFDTVFRNLTNPKKGGGIDQIFNGVKNPKAVQKATGYKYAYGQEPLGAAEAGSQFENLLGGALALLPSQTAEKYAAYASVLTDKAVLKDMKKAPGKGRDIPKMVGRRLFR